MVGRGVVLSGRSCAVARQQRVQRTGIGGTQGKPGAPCMISNSVESTAVDRIRMRAPERGASRSRLGEGKDTAVGGAWPFERAAPPSAQSWEWAYRAQLRLLTHLCQPGHNPLMTGS